MADIADTDIKNHWSMLIPISRFYTMLSLLWRWMMKS